MKPSLNELARTLFGGWRGEGRVEAANAAPIGLLLLVACLIFGIDMLVPLGLSIGTLYGAVVVISLWSRSRKVVVAVACVCTVLTLAGLFLSPEGGISLAQAISDRAISCAVLWLIAMLGLLYRRADFALWETLDRQRTLHRELDHRVRNNMAGLACLMQEMKAAGLDPARQIERVESTVHGMVAVYRLLSRGRWEAIPLDLLVREITQEPHRAALDLSGDDLLVSARQVSPVGMVLNEMVTNSVKHGAMSAPAGRVHISWTVAPTSKAAAQVVRLAWRESGGPRIGAKPAPGMGLRLVEGIISHELGGTVETVFAPEGCIHRLELMLDVTTPSVEARPFGPDHDRTKTENVY